MSSPEKKKKKKKKKPSNKPSPVILTPNPSLPDDLLLNCYARVSKLYHPTLSLVSKSFPSLLTSAEFHRTRSLVGRTESCLYVCLQFNRHSDPRWFTLCQKPNLGYVLIPITIPPSPQCYSQRVAVVVGSDIYFIGGGNRSPSSSSVLVLDCKSHTWRMAPSMLVERSFTRATVFNEKIYVVGGCNWIFMEVFDPKTQIWKPSTEPSNTKRSLLEEEIVVLGNYYNDPGILNVAYNPNEDSWDTGMGNNPELKRAGMSSCTIDNVCYTYYNLTRIKWYDSQGKTWKEVKGLENLPNLVVSRGAAVRLVDYGGKMAVLWDKLLPDSKEKMISCAVITLERRDDNQEIWGNIQWIDGVLTVPDSYEFVCALAPTV